MIFELTDKDIQEIIPDKKGFKKFQECKFFFSSELIFFPGKNKLMELALRKSRIMFEETKEQKKSSSKKKNKANTNRISMHKHSQSSSDEENSQPRSLEQLTNQKNSLIIRQLKTNANYAITEKGGKIGREKKCEISIPDKEVSKFNSEIIFVEGGYYLADRKSANGTFIKMDTMINKLKIEAKMVIELNNYQMKVLDLGPFSMMVEFVCLEKNEVKTTERIQFFEGKFFYLTMDDQNPKGYCLSFKEKMEGKYDLEFKTINDNKYMILSPTFSFE